MANTTKASGKLVFGVDFNNANALTAINAMKRDVRNLATEMRNTESSFRASGESMQAMTTKVNSLKTIIEQQTNLVKQAKAAEDAYGKTTDADGIKLQRLANEHKAAENQLKSYQRQLERAQVVLQQYDSSLLKSRENSRTWTNLLGTTKKELESSGQAYTRNSELTKTYSQSVNALTTQLDAEQKTLKNIEELDRRSGMKEHSQEYLQQASNVKKVSTELNKARHEMKDYVSGYTELTARTKSYGQATTDIVARLNAEKKSVSANVAELARLKSERGAQAKIVQLEAGKLKELDGTLRNTEAYDKQVSALNKAQKKYAETSEQIKLLNKNYGGLGQTSARLGDHLVNIGNKATTLGDKFSRASQTTTQASTAVIGAFVYGSKKAIDLQDSFVKTTNLVLDNGKATKNYAGEVKNLGQMQADASKLSMKYGVAQQEIADGYQELIKRGYTSAQALGAQNDLLKASVASGDSYKETVNTATAAMESFGLTTDKAGRPLTNTKLMTERTSKSLTEMTYAANRTATDFGSMGVAMEYVGNTAHQAGFSLSETSAAIGTLSNAGLEADKAGTGLRKTINSLISPTKNGEKALKGLGLSMKDFTDNNGNLKDMSTIFGLLQDRMKDMSGKQRNDVFHALFGTTGQAAGGILVSNSAALKKLNDETENSYKNNYMGKLADKNQESAKQQLKIFKATLDSISMTLAKDWLPVVTDMAKKLNGWLQNVNKLSDGHKKLLAGIALGIPTFTLLTGALSAVLKIIGGFGKVGVGMLNFLGAGRSKATQQTESVIALTASINNLTRATEEYNLTGGLKATSPTASPIIPRGGKVAPEKTTTYMPSGAAIEHELTDNMSKATKGAGGTAAKLGKGLGGKFVAGLGAALAVWDVGSSIYDAVQSDKSKAKIASASKIVGTLIGGGIGAMIAGPAGAMMGASIGDAIGSAKTTQKIIKALKHQSDTFKDRYGKGGAVTVGVSPQVKVNKPKLAKQFKEKAKGLGAQFAKIDDLNIKLGMATNKKDREKVKKEIDDLYKHIGKSADDSVKKRTKSEKAFLDQQYKDGLINKKQHDDLVKNLNESDKKRVENNKYDLDALKNNTKVTNDSIASLEKLHSTAVAKINKKAVSKRKKLKKDEASALASIEGAGFVEINGKFYKGEKGRQQVADLYAKKRKDLAKNTGKKLANQEKDDSKVRTGVIKDMAKARVAQEKKLGIDIAGNMTSGSKKQKSILNQLKSAKGKISEKMAQKLINDSAKATNKQIKDAENERKKTVAAAKKKRNKTVEHAKWMYKNVDGYTKDQMNNAIKHADNERDVTIAAAKEKKKQTVKHAKKQNEDVVKEAASESKSVSTHAMRSGENGVYAWRKHTGGLWDVWNWISSTWNWIAKALGGNSMKAPKDKPTQGKPTWKVGAYATGGRGNGLALVGEAGPELAYEPYSGSARILGAKGAQLANVKASEYILDAEKTQRVLNGSYEGKLPAYAGGKVVNFLTSAVEKVKDFAGDISDKVQGVLDGPEKAIKGILGKFKISGLGSNGNSWMKGIKNASKDLFINAIKKIADALTAGGKFDGKIGPHGVYDYLWKVAQRTIKKYGMTVKSGYRPGDRYYHGKHQAIDIGWAPSRNGDRAYKKVADWVFNTFPKQVAYVITQGQVRDRKGLSGQPAIGRWEHWPDNDHYDHLHINGMWGPSDIGVSGGKGSGSWRNQIKQAARAMHVNVTNGEIARILHVISNESNGSPTVVNHWDRNAQLGHPSKGLLQYVQSTFDTYKVKGHGNILSGYDQLLALFNDKTWRRDLTLGGWGPSGPRRYANGGIVNKNQMIEVAEGNMPEAVVPLTKGSRAWKLLQSIINHYAGNELVNQTHDAPITTQDTQGFKKISDKIDILIDTVKQLSTALSGLTITMNNQKVGQLVSPIVSEQQMNDINYAERKVYRGH